MGAFLVLESREHAKARGAKPRARISPVCSDRNARHPGESEASLRRQWEAIAGKVDRAHAAVISGATGLEPATSAERACAQGHWPSGSQYRYVYRAWGRYPVHGQSGHRLRGDRARQAVRATGSGDTGESPPGLSQVVVTSVGNWRGEGLALLERVD
jgi:3-oxoacyl-[acyl-carrier-protein] synthase II